MNLFTKCWVPQHRNLICLVKKYPIAYLASPKKITNLNKIKLDSAWKEIALKLGQPSKKCKLLWTKIKLKYAKIMILINTGKITKEVAMSHPETHKFFDGLLSFLDPYISDITDEDIPVHIHKSINNLYGFITTHVKGSHKEDNCHFITHAQVKSLLTERELRGDVVDSLQIESLQAMVNIAVQSKLEELMKNASSNSSKNIRNIDDEDTINVTMLPNKNVQFTHKSKAFNYNPSENIPNKDEENRARTINLGLKSELIIEDDIKTEEENYENIHDEYIVKEENVTLEYNINNTTGSNFDQENSFPTYSEIAHKSKASNLNPSKNIHNNDEENRARSINLGLKSELIIENDIKTEEVYENIHDEDIVKEENFTLGYNINNTTSSNFDQEIGLPTYAIIKPVVYDMQKNTKCFNETAINIEDNTKDMTDNAPPVTDEYLRHFFGELGVIMSVELSLERQKVLKSRINELLKSNLLKEG